MLAAAAPAAAAVATVAREGLPERWWTPAERDQGGYQLLAHAWVMGRKVVTLLDSGAAVNAVTEELIVGCISRARDYGLDPKDPAYPI
eukprot:11637234-Alexandrium_andersonii.AAC.1